MGALGDTAFIHSLSVLGLHSSYEKATIAASAIVANHPPAVIAKVCKLAMGVVLPWAKVGVGCAVSPSTLLAALHKFGSADLNRQLVVNKTYDVLLQPFWRLDTAAMGQYIQGSTVMAYWLRMTA